MKAPKSHLSRPPLNILCLSAHILGDGLGARTSDLNLFRACFAKMASKEAPSESGRLVNQRAFVQRASEGGLKDKGLGTSNDAELFELR